MGQFRDDNVENSARTNAQGKNVTSVQVLQPPAAFGIVEPDVYRSSALQPINFEFIRTLNLRTIVYLSPDVTLRALSKFMEESNIRLIHLGLKSWKPSSWKPMSEELVKEALEIALDKDYHPLLLMCTSGVHQTGTLVGCLRRLQQWSFASIIDEYRNVAGRVRTRYNNEHFIELFDTDLVTLPKNLPWWFVVQEMMFEEEVAEHSEIGHKQHTEEHEGETPAYKLHYYKSTVGPLQST